MLSPYAINRKQRQTTTLRKCAQFSPVGPGFLSESDKPREMRDGYLLWPTITASEQQAKHPNGYSTRVFMPTGSGRFQICRLNRQFAYTLTRRGEHCIGHTGPARRNNRFPDTAGFFS